MRKLDIRNFAPPGYDIGNEIYHFKWGLFLACLYSAQILIRIIFEVSVLYTEQDPGLMTDFAEFIGISFIVFPILICVMIGYIPIHYLYFRQGSKSIYQMRRLKNPIEYHFRCVAVPLICSVTALAAAFALLVLYFCIYLFLTPKACLPPDQWQKIWSVIL